MNSSELTHLLLSTVKSADDKITTCLVANNKVTPKMN